VSAETGLAGVLVILLIFAFAIPAGFGAWLASTKGRSAIAWFFLCGIFSWIAVLALGLSPVAERPVDWAPVRPTKVCPECGEDIQPEATICRFCRHEFSPDDVMASRREARELDDWKLLGEWSVSD